MSYCIYSRNHLLANRKRNSFFGYNFYFICPYKMSFSKANKQTKSRLIDTEKRLVVAERRVFGDMKYVKRIK